MPPTKAPIIVETIEIILLSEPISTSERFKPFNKKHSIVILRMHHQF